MSAPETAPAAPIPATVPTEQTDPNPVHDESAEPKETITEASAPAGEPAPVVESKESKEPEKSEAKENRRSGFFNISKLIPTTFKRSSRKEKRDQRSSSEETPKETEVKATEPKEAEAPVPAPAPAPVETEAAAEPADTEAAAPPPATTEGETAPKSEDQAEKEEAKDKLLPEPSKAVDDVKAKASKVGRRLSARMNLFFKPKSKEEVPQQKVNEEPPKIEEPKPVAPLENLSQPEALNAAEEPKPEAAPAAPAVAAAA